MVRRAFNGAPQSPSEPCRTMLTMARLVVPVFIILAPTGLLGHEVVAFVFALASITDHLDRHLARSRQVRSPTSGASSIHR